MSQIDDVRERLDIVEVVSEYVALQKAGRNFKALCPFHTEKTASFFVFPESQRWHCFGSCGTGGDAFSFVMKKEGLDFGGALRFLARKAGVSLAPMRARAEDREEEKLRQINETAARYYHHLLLNAPPAQGAREYLERRDVSAKTVEDFQLGFSLDNWDGVKLHLMERGCGEEELLAAGLLAEREDGGTYDRFRQRLMFPISDPQGRVVGFGARVLDDSLPKYINSPQTAIFDKGGMLYGLDRARGAIRGRDLAVIVEGYMDVIIAHQYGMNNVVASMGTALSEKQVAVLKRVTTKLVLALDADAAGEEATLRGLQVAWQALPSTNMRVVLLPQGKDPDEVIRESPEAWQRLVDEALPMMEYRFETAKATFDLSRVEGRSAAANELLRLVDRIDDRVEQELYLQKLARLVGVDERTLARQAAHLRGTTRSRRGSVREEVPSASASVTLGDPLEEYCLSLLLQHPVLKERCEGLSPDYFQRAENREIFVAWRHAADLESLRRTLDDSLQEHLDSLVSRELPPTSQMEGERALADCLRRLRERRLRYLKTHEEHLLSEGELQGKARDIAELAFAGWRSEGLPPEGGEGDSGELAELQRQGIEINSGLREVFTEAKRGRGKRELGKEAERDE